jgi:uncharacterized OsmC-like protein
MTTTHTTDTTEVNDSMRNGVDTAALFATLDAVKQAPQAARFQFRAHNQWHSGTHNRGTITDFFGAGEERAHERTFVFDADHPAVLVGQDQGPTPVEFVLHALAACLTAGLANIAAARKVKLTEVRSTVTGDIDLNGILGLNPDVRNGYQQLTVRFTVKGDAPAEKLRELVEQSRARSAVFDVITNQVPVTIEVDIPDARIRCHDAPQARIPGLAGPLAGGSGNAALAAARRFCRSSRRRPRAASAGPPARRGRRLQALRPMGQP